jgi:hypothetical protein
MAKRRNRKQRKNKIEPSEMTLTFATVAGAPGSTTSSYIDLSQVASLVNRRFYRQGINWAVAGFKILGPSLSSGQSAKASLLIEKLPNTWVMSNSWEKSFRTWNKMNKDALDEAESVRGRFLDFKIYADADHHAAGFGTNLLPANVGGIATVGEWIPSEIRVPNSATNNTTSGFELIAVGANYPGAGASGKDAVSLIQGYANSRALPSESDPNVPADATDAGPSGTPENWMSALHNDGITQDSEVLTDITAYDQLPYPFENDGTALTSMYPGGETQLPALMVHDQSRFSSTTIGGITYMKGGNFPCGLIKLSHEVHAESITHNVIVQVDLVPGSHRGYLCESMTEM